MGVEVWREWGRERGRDLCFLVWGWKEKGEGGGCTFILFDRVDNKRMWKGKIVSFKMNGYLGIGYLTRRMSFEGISMELSLLMLNISHYVNHYIVVWYPTQSQHHLIVENNLVHHNSVFVSSSYIICITLRYITLCYVIYYYFLSNV